MHWTIYYITLLKHYIIFFFIEPGSLKGLWDEKLGRLRIHRKTFVHFFRRWRHSKPHTCNMAVKGIWNGTILCNISSSARKNTSASRLESSWALFRCNFRTRDRSAHSPPRLCRWDPLPGDGGDSKGDNLILLVYSHNLWVRATTWICWFHWRTWSEGIHCHLFGICVDPWTFVLSVTQTAPPDALMVCTPDVLNIQQCVTHIMYLIFNKNKYDFDHRPLAQRKHDHYDHHPHQQEHHYGHV